MKQKEQKINKPIVVSPNVIFDFFRKEISDTRDTVNDLIRDNRKMPIVVDRKVKSKMEW